MTNQPPITEVLLSSSELQFGIDQSALNRGHNGGLKSTHACATVISIGNEAADILHKGQTGRVLAVFDRSFYVQSDQAVFCIGVASLGQGPLHVLLASDEDNLPLKVNTGALVCLQKNLRPADVNYAAPYSGKVSVHPLNLQSLKTVQLALRLVMPPAHDGFAWTLERTDWQCPTTSTKSTVAQRGSVHSSLRNQCLPAIRSLDYWLESSIAQRVKAPDGAITHTSISPVPALLGAGPGLTPSGDDLLAGVMLALHRIRRADVADTLWQTLEPHLAQRTNAISGAHLHMASRGQCSESVMSLLECVFGDTGCNQIDDAQLIASNIESLANRIGASSGWDTLAGMSLVLLAL